MSLLLYTERLTRFAEVDVFVTECRYNESDKVIRKMKGLKVCYSIPLSFSHVTWAQDWKIISFSLPLSNSSCLPQPLLMRFTSSVKRCSH